MKIWINGRLVPEAEACISVLDHGLLYGDGVFEGIRAYNGRVFMLEEHIDRLFRSARAISLRIPATKRQMIAAVVRVCRENNVMNGYVRVVVTRGVGSLGLNPYLCKKPQIIIIAASIQLYPEKVYRNGMAIVTVGTVRNHPEALNPRIKSLNYLNNILAKIEAVNAGASDALMLNAAGFVAEATGENVFAVTGDAVLTPPPEAGVLEGITRSVVMKIASEMGRRVRECMMNRYDLYTADEVFLTGTAAEVVPVVEIDARPVGTGRPGKITREIARRFHDFARSTGHPIR